jgi:RimJ/RimL family protein N-acetyltransferase
VRDHYDALAGVVQDPQVALTLWPGELGGPRTAAQTQTRLDEHISHWDEHGFGLWMFFERAGGAAIGYAGPRRTVVEDRPEIEIAYAVTSTQWGKGFATEMARAATKDALARCGQTGLVCFTLESNRASQRVMEKAGFRYERDIVRAGLPHVLYRLSAQVGSTGGSVD